MTYIDGFVVPVPEGKRPAYADMAKQASKVFLRHGALRVVEGWGDDIPEGKINDFRTAVLAKEGQQIVFSWVEWPSRDVRDAGMAAAMKDPDMPSPENLPFVGKHLIWGGFTTLLDTSKEKV